ncbi:MAG: Asd/ArgC dimerization domain-containing protein [Desulfuromonadaceae bacterium]|nr:Asd/ArgC dimerization domain-containing protein [Desulfuromonas sp.]MDY0184717.1 Asd/ArgC dimerization domain-containing protein [Desulfuromonadaceae bacterium]
MQYNIVVVGATGQVGGQVILELEERAFPVKKLLAFASENSVGESVEFNGAIVPVQPLDDTAFVGADIVFFCVPAHVCSDHLAQAVKQGAFCIDLSGAGRSVSTPFIVPELTNAQVLKSLTSVVSPPVAAIQAALLLAPIKAKFGIKEVSLTVLQSASSLGAGGVDALRQQSGALLNGRPLNDMDSPADSPAQLAYNLTPVSRGGANYPGIDGICSAVCQLLGQPEISCNGELIQAPIFYANGLSLMCNVASEVSAESVSACLAAQAGVDVVSAALAHDFGNSAAQQYTELPVAVTRVTDKGHIILWSVIDNLRKGSALNAVQIAEMFVACQ